MYDPANGTPALVAYHPARLRTDLGPRGQRLALLHVDDLARAVIAALAHFAACAGGHYALDDGTPMGYDWPMLARAVRGSGRLLRIPVPRALLAALAALNLAAARCLARAPMLTPGKVRELSEAYWLCDNRTFSAATGGHRVSTSLAGRTCLVGAGNGTACICREPAVTTETSSSSTN